MVMESVGVTLLYPLTRHTWSFLFQDCYSPFFPFQPPTTQFLEGKLTFIMQFISLLLIQSVCLQGPYSIINVCSHFPFSRASILELWGQQLTLIMAFPPSTVGSQSPRLPAPPRGWACMCSVGAACRRTGGSQPLSQSIKTERSFFFGGGGQTP